MNPQLTDLQMHAAHVKNDAHSATHIAHQFMNWFSGVSAAISVTPFVLSALDVGQIRSARSMLDYNNSCCSIIASKKPFGTEGSYSLTSVKPTNFFPVKGEAAVRIAGPTYGIGGAISHALLKIPGIGYYLGTGMLPEALQTQLRKIPKYGDEIAQLRLSNALAAGGIILIGELGGTALERWQQAQAAKHAHASGEDADHARAEAGGAGRAVALGTKAMGLFVALPTILAGVGHAVQLTTATFGIDTLTSVKTVEQAEGIGGHIMAFLGKPVGECGGAFKVPSGALAASLVGICCTVPAVISTLPMLMSREHVRRPSNNHHTNNHHTGVKPVEPKQETAPESVQAEMAATAARFAQLEHELERAEKKATVAKWSIRAVGTAAVGLLGMAFLKKTRGTGVSSELAERAQQVRKRFAEADNADEANRFTALVNRVEGVTQTELPLLGEEGSLPLAAELQQKASTGVDKLAFRLSSGGMKRPQAPTEGSKASGWCCGSHCGLCCAKRGNTYFHERHSRAQDAVIGEMLKAQNTGDAAEYRQLAFGGAMAAGVGAVFALAKQAERAILGGKRSEKKAIEAKQEMLAKLGEQAMPQRQGMG